MFVTFSKTKLKDFAMPLVIIVFMGLFSFFTKDKKEVLDKGLEKTKTSVLSKIARAVAGKTVVDDDVLDNVRVRLAKLEEMISEKNNR